MNKNEQSQQDVAPETPNSVEAQEKLFNYQLECLKLEMTLVDGVINRYEQITQNVKNFAIVCWAAAITVFMSQQVLRPYIATTAVLPILFWVIDSIWLSQNRGASLRLKKISEFINNPQFIECFKQKQLLDFHLLDMRGKQYIGTREYEADASFKKIFWYKEIMLLYGGLAILSLALGIGLAIVP